MMVTVCEGELFPSGQPWREKGRRAHGNQVELRYTHIDVLTLAMPTLLTSPLTPQITPAIGKRVLKP